ncbi:hypothetical protein BJX64DRAFT_245926 [Aspergillus heterothallicus]
MKVPSCLWLTALFLINLLPPIVPYHLSFLSRRLSNPETNYDTKIDDFDLNIFIPSTSDFLLCGTATLKML